jgi:hypothetical protein
MFRTETGTEPVKFKEEEEAIGRDVVFVILPADVILLVAGAVEDGITAFTVTDTIAGLSLAAPLLSLTVRENFNIYIWSDDTLGAVNDAVLVSAPFNIIDGPATCVHE